MKSVKVQAVMYQKMMIYKKLEGDKEIVQFNLSEDVSQY